MVWCNHCGKSVSGIRPYDGALACNQCGRILENFNFSTEVTFVKNAAGQSQASGNVVRSVQSGVSSSRERRIRLARDEFMNLRDGLGLGDERDDLIDMATRFFTMAVEQNFTKGRRTELVQCSCLYLTCREKNIPFLLIDFSSYLRVSVYELGAVYLQLCEMLYLTENRNYEKLVDPSIYIPRFSNALLKGKQDKEVMRTARDIIASMKRDWIQTGRKPSGICGAALYTAALAHGIKCSKTDIVGVVHICEATLTKRLNEFGDTEAGSLNVEELSEREREMHKRSFATNQTSSKETVHCMHQDSKPVNYGLCEECYRDFISVSGGLVGGSDPPAFQRAEKERMEKEKAAREENEGGISSLNHDEQLNSKREPVYSSVSKSAKPWSEKGDGEKDEDGSEVSDESGNFSDVSDTEVDCYINNEEERRYKKVVWEEMNKEYIKEQADKEAALKAANDALNASSSNLPVHARKLVEASRAVQSRRGLRQGCSLSPYLFVVCMNVLSRLLDEAVVNGKFGYHPKCEKLELTHLCFADDMMVFADGSQQSIEGILQVFEEFDKMSGLKISLEKSTLFLAGVSSQQQEDILSHFPFANGKLPVRYLGLPLLTKKMTVLDYMPLIEKIRKRIGSWTGRFLSYAGRLQLIKSVITSLVNFWMAAFRLPSGCIKEIESLCSAFLWSGPDLNRRKAKVSWLEICRPKKEGGLGLRRLKEVNMVSCLKLVWRILSANSIWVNWVKVYLIRKGSLWMVKENTQTGSWMWRKLLQCRGVAQKLYKVEINNGRKSSFWFENWSTLGCLRDILGEVGCITLGIPIKATVEESWKHRRRYHRVTILNKVEDEIDRNRNKGIEEDMSLWLCGKSYKRNFSSKETWEFVRERHLECHWSNEVWFQYATPKYSFIMWMAMKGRLATGDRMRHWNSNVLTSCVLCTDQLETVEHLFFGCCYSAQIWKALMQGILREKFTLQWGEIQSVIRRSKRRRMHQFIVHYMFQAAVYMIWRERNRRRHGEIEAPAGLLIKLLDKNMRNKLYLIQRRGNKEFGAGLQYWFATREDELRVGDQ